MQLIGGLLNDIIILGIFIFLALVLSGKIKFSGARQEKIDSIIQKRGKLLKVFIYGGGVLLIFLIISKAVMFNGSGTVKHEWTVSDKEAMTKVCLDNAQSSFQRDPHGTRNLCNCVTDKYTLRLTYEQAMELDKKPQQEQMDIIMPILNECQNEAILD